MLSFSYRSFKDYLQSNLEKSELRFMMRTFGYASLFFLLFGLFVLLAFEVLDTFLSKTLGVSGWGIYSGFLLLGFILSFPLSYFSIKYRNNPLRVPGSFVIASYTLLTLAFLFMFLGFAGLVGKIIIGSDDQSRLFIQGAIGSVFGLSFLIYLIPAAFGFFIANRKTAMAVNKFLNILYMIYFILLVIFLIAVFVGVAMPTTWCSVVTVLVAIILFVSPVLTIYKLKTVAAYINYEDPYERKKWENYFSFEIAYQLLQLAFHLLRIAFMLISSSSRSRLR